MKQLFNDKILKLIPIIFLFVIILKTAYTYTDTKSREYEFAKKEAEVLNGYFLENRNYYQRLFLDGTLELSQKTLPALPAFSATPISLIFSHNNPLNLSIKTVSDKARNIKNQADKNELKAIEYFKQNPNETIFFSDEDQKMYQFGSVLKIEQKCLKCHGSKKNAPAYIREKYDTAYDYKLGDVRGIVSIQIPKQRLSEYFFKNFTKSALFDMTISLLLFGGVFYLIKQSKKVNIALERKVAQKTNELKNSYLIDRLTLLPNRLKLIEEIEKKEKDSDHAHLALINVDSFKDINDFYGYEAGDELLIKLSKKIREFYKDARSHVYKLPNDEFAIYTTAEISDEEFLKHIKNLIEKIGETPLSIANQSVFVSFSCGIASNQSSILIKANNALQSAKKRSKSIVIYKDSLDTKEQITKNVDALMLLKDAIKNDLITPYFQPIYNTKTKKIEKYETLARIVTSEGKIIPPFAFLGIAVKSKLYPEITKAIITKSFEFFKDKDYEFSVNLSIVDIQSPEIMKFLLGMLKEYKKSHLVIFEILESDKIENYEEIKNFIKEVKKYGCKIAIDDFGSGYSNFSHIFELNVDCLKIDGSLVKFITTDESSRIIVKTIINFASNLGLKTIAEFVEDKDSLELLEKMGIDFVQGYFIGKPENSLIDNFKP